MKGGSKLANAGVSVAYSPTKANSLILAKIRPLPMLEGIAFAPLPEFQAERIGLIKKMQNKERVLFLWGDGKCHDESYHFTARPAREGIQRLKVNLDPHSDEYTCHDDGGDIDFETMKPKRGNLRLMSYSNHMSCTEASGVNIFTSERMSNGGLMLTVMEEFTNLLIQMITNQGMMRFVKDASMKAISFNGEVDITLDLDLVRGLPVMKEFMNTKDAVNAARILSVLEGTLPMVSLFDAGGLVEKIPNFHLIEDIPLNKSPKESDILTFIEAANEPELAEKNKGIVDAVGSYTAMFLANLIRIFSESRELFLGKK